MKATRAFILKEEFIADLAEALSWYKERGEQLEQDLFHDAHLLLKHIEQHPGKFFSDSEKLSTGGTQTFSLCHSL